MDDIILMAEGHIIYQGPRTKITSYFETLGYRCPPLVDVADFLVQIPTHEGARFVDSSKSRDEVPLGASRLAAAWKASSLFRSMLEEEDPDEQKGGGEGTGHQWDETVRVPYAGSLWFHTKLLIARQFLLLRRNTAYVRGRVGQVLVVGAVTGSLFNTLSTSDYISMMGVIFFCGMFLALSNFAMIPSVIADRDVFAKQSIGYFYPTLSYVVSKSIADYPIFLTETIVFCSIVYWSVGMSAEEYGGRFFMFLLVVFLFCLSLSQIFRSIVYLISSPVASRPLCGLAVMIMVLFSGFICPKNVIPDPWIWAYYLNPVAWMVQALLINQFISNRYDFPVGNGSEERFGHYVLRFNSFETEYIWVWYAIIYMGAVYVGLLLCSVVILNLVRPSTGYVPVSADPELEEEGEFGGFKTQEIKFHPTTFVFKDIWYTVKLGSEELDLLRGVSGYFNPGTLTALMGSSGAGKTTLLDVLSGRKTTGKIKGLISVNGKPKNQKTFRRVMAYVEQFDTLAVRDTAREAVEFSAALRLPREISTEARDAWVRDVLHSLELESLENTIVGLETEGGMSFEQRKRVSIAVELAANPSMIFLDEPTTGLDSRAAQVLVRVVRRLAASGRSIVCTIHQPSSYIFNNFDSLLLLKRGGQTVYFGELGEHCSKLIDYFTRIPGVRAIEHNQNPATWMLDQIGAGTTGASSSAMDFHEYYKRSPEGRGNAGAVEALISEMEVDDQDDDDTINNQLMHDPEEEEHLTHYNASELTQLRYLIWRSFISYWRTPSYNIARMIVNLIIALIFGSVYSQQVYRNVSDIRARVGVMYTTLSYTGTIGLMTVIPVVLMSRKVFRRERLSSMYRVYYYELSMGLVEIPYLIVSALVFTLPFFFIVGFDKGDVAKKFFWYWFFEYIYLHTQIMIGHFLGWVAPSEDVITGECSKITCLHYNVH